MTLEDSQLHSLISVKLNVVNVKMSRQIGQAVQKLENLRLPEWRILALLAQAGALSQADIRVQIGMDKGQISRTIKNMLASELVENENGSAKSRNVRLGLTEKGVAVHQRVDIMMEQRNSLLLASLSVEEKQSLFDGLDLIEKAVEKWSM